MIEDEWDDLLSKAAEGDQSATAQLTASAREIILLYYLKGPQKHPQVADLDDLTQEATTSVFNSLRKKGFKRYLSSQEAFRNFVVATAKRSYREFLRKGRKRLRDEAGAAENLNQPSPEGPEQIAQRHELLRSFDCLVSQLPPPDADVFRLYCAGRTPAEISSLLGISVRVVSTMALRARRRIRELLPHDKELLTTAGARYSPELHQWALQNLDVEEAAATLKELREKGGLRLRDFLHELEQIVEEK